MKAYLLAVFSIVALTLSAQSHRFADSTAQWNVMHTEYYFTAPSGSYTYEYTVQTDTVINGKSYQKIAHSDVGDWIIKPTYFIRKDSAQKVYSFNIDSNAEFLLYDFSLQQGDTITLKDYNGVTQAEYSMTVDAVSTINLGYSRKVLTLGEFTWIEGIGSIRHPFDPVLNYQVIDGPSYGLLCFFENNQLTYHYEFYDTCNYRTPVGINEAADENVSLSPNPTSNNFTLALSQQPQQGTNILIHDALGRIVKREELVSSTQQISVADLPNGMYTYTVTQNSARQPSGKLIVSH